MKVGPVCSITILRRRWEGSWKRAENIKRLRRLVSKYEVIIYWSHEDDAYVAEVPEVSGCMADGSSYQAALANAEVVIQKRIDIARELGRPIPEPKGRLTYA